MKCILRYSYKPRHQIINFIINRLLCSVKPSTETPQTHLLQITTKRTATLFQPKSHPGNITNRIILCTNKNHNSARNLWRMATAPTRRSANSPTDCTNWRKTSRLTQNTRQKHAAGSFRKASAPTETDATLSTPPPNPPTPNHGMWTLLFWP